MSDWDITLNGVDYMLIPKTYRASSESDFHDSQIAREYIADFPGLALTRSPGLLDGSGVWPAPWPAGRTALGPAPAAQAITGTLNVSEPKLSCADASYLFIAAGATLFRWNRAVASAPVNRKTLAAAATGLTRLLDTLYIAHGAGADVAKYVDATNTLTASALGAGVKATMLTTFARALVIVPAANPVRVQAWFDNSLTTALSWDLDGPIRAWTQHGDALVIATDAGLYRLSGAWLDDGTTVTHSFELASWGSFSGVLQDTDDFAWLVVYNGSLIAWVGHRVLLYDAPRDTWRQTGLEGSSTLGAAVVNGWLLVALTPKYDAGAPSWQLWAYDGAGWWQLDQLGSPNTLAFPAADGAGKLITFRAASDTAHAYDLDDVTTAANLKSPFSVTTPPLAAGAPDRRKLWRRIGIELNRLDAQPVGNWTVALSYSTDGGQTFTSAGSQAVTSPVASVGFPVNITAANLLVKAQLTRTSGLPPFITALWAEHELLDDSARRRRWTFKVHAADKRVNRAGAADSRSGQQIRAALWSLFSSASSVLFRDIDYAATTYTVRLTALREEWPAPAQQSDLGADTVLELTLVEV